MRLDKPKCQKCDKPLGSTITLCHECGGRTYRGGTRIQAWEWQIYLIGHENVNWDAMTDKNIIDYI